MELGDSLDSGRWMAGEGSSEAGQGAVQRGSRLSLELVSVSYI